MGIFNQHCQIFMFKNGMQRLTCSQKENSIYYLKTISVLANIRSMSQNFIIQNLSNIGNDEVIHH